MALEKIGLEAVLELGGFQAAFDKFESVMLSIPGTIGNVVDKLTGGGLAKALDDLIPKFQNFAHEAKNKLTDTFSNIAGGIQGMAMTGLANLGRDLLSFVQDAVKGTEEYSKVTDAIGGVKDTISGLIQTLSGPILDTVATLINKLNVFLQDPAIQQSIQEMAEWLATALPEALEWLATDGVQAMQDFAAAIMDVVQFVGDLVTGIENIATKLEELGPKILDWFTQIGSGGQAAGSRPLDRLFGGLSAEELPDPVVGHSPPPLAQWLTEIGESAAFAGAQLYGVGGAVRGMPAMTQARAVASTVTHSTSVGGDTIVQNINDPVSFYLAQAIVNDRKRDRWSAAMGVA